MSTRRPTCSAISAGCTTTSPASRCPRQLDALLALTTLEHLHYGSDYPFTPELVVERAATALAGARPTSLLDQLAVNTAQLFPELHRHDRPRDSA